MVVLMLGAGLCLLLLLLSLAIRLRLGIPLVYVLLMLTVFHGWYQAHTALARHPSPPGRRSRPLLGGDAGAEGG